MSATNTSTSLSRRETLNFYPATKISKIYGRSKQVKELQAHLTLAVSVIVSITLCAPILTLLSPPEWVANVLCFVALVCGLVAANKFYNHLDSKQALSEDDARMKEAGSLIRFMHSNGYIVDRYLAENMLAGRYYSGITDFDGNPYVVMGASVWKTHFRFELRPDRSKMQRVQDEDME